MNQHRTVFGSLSGYTPGSIEIIDDDPANYAFSNVFDVAAKSAPYEKVVVGRHRQYVIETLRAEGVSRWHAAAHDEFALVMDGEIDVELIRLADPDAVVASGSDGAVALDAEPVGTKMGWMRLRRGHQALLPPASAYRFTAAGAPGVVLLQTRLGPLSVQRWAGICRS